MRTRTGKDAPGKGEITNHVPTKKSATANLGSAEHDAYSSGPDTVTRNGGEVWCRKRNAEALVSVVEREGPEGQLRYVQWCSLIDLEECGQECLCQLPKP